MAAVKVIDHVLHADDTLTVLALRYGSDPGAIMRENKLISSDLDFLPLRVVRKQLKSASDGSVTEIGIIEREGTVLRIPVLEPTAASMGADSVENAPAAAVSVELRRHELALAAVLKWADHRRGRGGSTQLPRMSREEAIFYLSENQWDPAAAKVAIERDDTWELDARKRDAAAGKSWRQR